MKGFDVSFVGLSKEEEEEEEKEERGGHFVCQRSRKIVAIARAMVEAAAR